MTEKELRNLLLIKNIHLRTVQKSPLRVYYLDSVKSTRKRVILTDWVDIVASTNQLILKNIKKGEYVKIGIKRIVKILEP